MCSASGNVTATAGRILNCGGIAGHILAYDVSSCNYSSGTVTASAVSGSLYSLEIGGLCGVFFNSRIENCSNTGLLTSSANVQDTINAGGLVGYYSSDSSINNSYSSGEITLSGTSSFTDVGGLIGFSFCTTTNISNCYAAGSISASGATLHKGGLLGDESYSTSTISDCYWLGGMGGSSDYSTGGIGYANSLTVNSLTMLTSDQLKNTGTIGSTSTTFKLQVRAAVIRIRQSFRR